MNLNAPAGSREARVLLRIAADAISAIWVVVALTIRLGLIEHEGWARHTLGNPHGLWPLQLLTFSFIHDNTPWSDSYWSLVMHLLWLWGMISIASEWMNLTDLIRVYSVATIGTGLVCLLLARAFHLELHGARPGLVIGALVGSVAAHAPHKEVFIWGELMQRLMKWLFSKGALFAYLLILAAAGLATEGTGPIGAFVGFARSLWLYFAAMRLPLFMAAFFWLGIELSECGLRFFFEDKFPIVGVVFPCVALAFGACYGLVEKWWRGRATRSPA